MGQSCSRAQDIHRTHGTELIAGAVYEFHNPITSQPSLEIIFMHGLQMGDFKPAYWKTWCTPEGEVWPMIWLGEDYKNARILSLCYDTSVWRTSSIGNTTPMALSDSILQHMMDVKIGQSNCPVIFVCHSLGGLLAKHILLTAVESPKNLERQNLLNNFKAIFFYATPHGGSNLATFASIRHVVSMSPMVRFLQELNHDARTLNEKFIYEFSNKFKSDDWKLYIVAEGAKTTKFGIISAWVVHPKSAKTGHDKNFLLFTEANHSTVCKPKTKTDKGYCHLIKCIEVVLKDHKMQEKNRIVDLAVKTFGIDDKVKSIRNGLENVSILGLVGMSGVGKTTLSKAFYNLEVEAHRYKKSSYLENASHYGLEELQKKLFEDLFPYEQVGNRGIQKEHLDKIRQCLETEKVLIVIDDVATQQNTLEGLQLLRKLEVDRESGLIIGFPLQVKVIVTSRNQDVLDEVVCQNETFSNELAIGNIEVFDQITAPEIEDLEELNSQNMKDSFIVKVMCIEVEGIQDGKNSNRDLFNHYAFHGVVKDESEKLKEMAKDIVGHCQGLPLSLEVIGEYLGQVNRKELDSQRRLERWEDAQRRLCAAESIDGSKDDKLWSCLRISYDNLASIEQDIFLALACVFSEFPFSVNSLQRIWKSPNAIEHLIKRSLLTRLEIGHEVHMHNQLRDMGRNISRLMDFGGPYLWEKEKIMDFIKTNPSSTTLKGVYLVGDGIEESLTKDEVDEDLWASSTLEQNSCQCYSKLQLLCLSKLNTQHVVEYFLLKCSKDKLRWLHLDSLRITPKGLQQIWSLKGLRVLCFWKCSQLEEIPSSLGNLIQLEELRIGECHMLQSLPETMDSLRQLQLLTLDSCSQLSKIPTGVGRLPILEFLNIKDCHSLEAVCKFEVDIESLQVLQIVHCNGLKHPIEGLGKLHKLQELVLDSGYRFMPDVEIPISWKGIAINFQEDEFGFPDLKVLALPSIPKILPSCPKLGFFLLENGSKLEEIPNDLFKNWPVELEELVLIDVHGCLRGLPNSIGNLVGLTKLFLINFPELIELSDDLIQPLSCLETIGLSKCKKLRHLPYSLADLPHLSKLIVFDCNAIEWRDEGQRALKEMLCKDRGIELIIMN